VSGSADFASGINNNEEGRDWERKTENEFSGMGDINQLYNGAIFAPAIRLDGMVPGAIKCMQKMRQFNIKFNIILLLLLLL
jgi:hypothetical protein